MDWVGFWTAIFLSTVVGALVAYEHYGIASGIVMYWILGIHEQVRKS